MSTNWMIYNQPCPHCGGVDFLEKATQENIVKIETRESAEAEVLFADYELNDVIVDDTDIQEVWCRGCDTQLL
jgi:phage terminase large subunit GpA-like protein